ncbi:hypothetical protein C8Q70DRAFT_518068 [Cubamyces menziesii]|nr:hypothetical protein C8Q70DRAFT_518068 [Cubamyces menziesii]
MPSKRTPFVRTLESQMTRAMCMYSIPQSLDAIEASRRTLRSPVMSGELSQSLYSIRSREILGQAGSRDEQRKPRETQTDLLHAPLCPRAHALGAERAKWGKAPLSGDAACDELNTDFDGPNGERSEVCRARHRLSCLLPDFHCPSTRSISC